MSFDLLARQLTREPEPHQVTGRPKLPPKDPKRDPYGKSKNPWRYTDRQLAFLAEIVERGSIESALQSMGIRQGAGSSLLDHMTHNSGLKTTIAKVVAYVRWIEKGEA